MRWKRAEERKIAVIVYLRPEMLKEIENLLEHLNVSRSTFLERLIEYGWQSIREPKNTGIV